MPSIPPLLSIDDNPEHYELLHSGHWQRKESVGRKKHSKMGRVLYQLLSPLAQQLGCELEQEWTVIDAHRKIIPDVTLSYPKPEIVDGYLVAPALLAVESRSSGQALPSLVSKCVLDHHSMGTKTCWIVDIDARTAYECNLGQKEAIPQSVLTIGSFTLPVTLLFEAFDAAL